MASSQPEPWRFYALNIQEMSFMEKLVGVITVPGETFKHITEKDLKKGLFVILVIAILSGLAGATYFLKRDIDTPFGDIRSQMSPFVAVIFSITYLIRWFAPSLLLAVFAKVMIGVGSAKRLLAMTSFGSIPLLVQQILRVIDSQIITSTEIKQIIASSFSGDGFVTQFLNEGLKVLNIFEIITVILTVYAVRENYGSSTGKAAQVTVLAYLAYVFVRTLLPLI